MDFVTKSFVKMSEWHKGVNKGQTMTEYALILAAVAVVVFAAYKIMGSDISGLASSIDNNL
jgi:Flp pilus assembly pilin Flp